jgi:hypothetical protein
VGGEGQGEEVGTAYAGGNLLIYPSCGWRRGIGLVALRIL